MDTEKFVKGYYCNSFYKDLGNAKIIGSILDEEDKLIHFFEKEITATSAFNSEIHCIKNMLKELELLAQQNKISKQDNVVIYGSGKGIIHRINHASVNNRGKIRPFKELSHKLKEHKNWTLQWQKNTKKILNKVLGQERGKNYMLPIHKALKDKNRIIFFDIEMNCTDDPHHNGWEAISIGAVSCDLNFNLIDSFHSYIKPILCSELSERCKVLTGIKQCNIDTAIEFNKVMELFCHWIGDYNNSIFVSWGIEDLNCIKRDRERAGNASIGAKEVIENHFDFQLEFSKQVGSKHQISLKNALNLCNVSFEGQQHHALYDAVNLLRLYKAFRTHDEEKILASS